jgi:hypothetical protein
MFRHFHSITEAFTPTRIVMSSPHFPQDIVARRTLVTTSVLSDAASSSRGNDNTASSHDMPDNVVIACSRRAKKLAPSKCASSQCCFATSNAKAPRGNCSNDIRTRASSVLPLPLFSPNVSEYVTNNPTKILILRYNRSAISLRHLLQQPSNPDQSMMKIPHPDSH